MNRREAIQTTALACVGSSSLQNAQAKPQVSDVYSEGGVKCVHIITVGSCDKPAEFGETICVRRMWEYAQENKPDDQPFDSKGFIEECSKEVGASLVSQHFLFDTDKVLEVKLDCNFYDQHKGQMAKLLKQALSRRRCTLVFNHHIAVRMFSPEKSDYSGGAVLISCSCGGAGPHVFNLSDLNEEFIASW